MPVPDSPNFDRALDRQARTGNLHAYISKSRVMEYAKNPKHFHIKYVLGIREPTNHWMIRGSEVHLAIENYYLNVLERFEDEGEIDDDLISYLPEDVTTWARWTEPFISNFLAFETDRLRECRRKGDESLFLPIEVEAEIWDWRGDDDVPLMGFADVVLHAASLSAVDSDDGVVIIDHKTGKVPDPKYREEGILLELEYYGMLFGDRFDVAAIAGYYPGFNELLIGELSDKRLAEIERIISEIETLDEDPEDYPIKQGPLCCWGKEPEKQSSFYGICPCNWATPSGPGPTYRDADKQPFSEYAVE